MGFCQLSFIHSNIQICSQAPFLIHSLIQAFYKSKPYISQLFVQWAQSKISSDMFSLQYQRLCVHFILLIDPCPVEAGILYPGIWLVLARLTSWLHTGLFFHPSSITTATLLSCIVVIVVVPPRCSHRRLCHCHLPTLLNGIVMWKKKTLFGKFDDIFPRPPTQCPFFVASTNSDIINVASITCVKIVFYKYAKRYFTAEVHIL